MRAFLLALPVLWTGLQLSASAATITPGTQIAVRPDQPIEMARWDRGRIYTAHVIRDVQARDGDVAIPRGATAELIVRRTGENEYTLDLESITVNGNRYTMDASGPEFHTHDYDNGGGIVGAIAGAVEGASGEHIEAHGTAIHVPQDAILRFNLRAPLHVSNWSDPGYDNNGSHYHHDHDWYR